MTTENIGKNASISRPSMDLESALNIMLAIYEKVSVNPFDDSMLATLLGYKTQNSGSYTRAKGALNSYQLIEKISDGKHKGLMKITDTYLHYITEISDLKKLDYLEIFLNSPTIFRAVKEWFPDLTTASKDMIMMQVIRNKKVDKGVAEEVAEKFLASYTFVKDYKNQGVSQHIVVANDLKEENSQPKHDLKLSSESQEISTHSKINTPAFIKPFSGNRLLIVQLPDEVQNLTEIELGKVLTFLKYVEVEVQEQIDMLNKEVPYSENED